PALWSVSEVIDWLRSRDIDENVCTVFRDHEVSGDVLLALDVDILKTELGISSLGKRLQIVDAIAEL
ncbi:sterile alpha motif/pointed domain-containing protein, partial [Vararia minispora EC-137]